MGFEPTCPLLAGKTLSRRPRYDRFGTSPRKTGLRVSGYGIRDTGFGTRDTWTAILPGVSRIPYSVSLLTSLLFEELLNHQRAIARQNTARYLDVVIELGVVQHPER